MPSKLTELVAKGVAQPPHNLENQIQYEVYTGSAAYGCPSSDSDVDVYGWAIPEKKILFPHLNGYIPGFGPKPQGFDVYTQHHMVIRDEKKEYDYSIYSIVKFFDLCMGNNPNMLDSLYVPERCVLFMTPLGQRVRENRSIFLSRRVLHTLRGYAWQQLHKLRIKQPTDVSKRRAIIDEFGFDVKFAYHVVRLVEECKMLLTEGTMDLERYRNIYKSIRAGEWSLEQVEEYFKTEEPRLMDLEQKSDLPKKPDIDKIKELLLDCLSTHFQGLDGAVVRKDQSARCLDEIREVLNRYDS